MNEPSVKEYSANCFPLEILRSLSSNKDNFLFLRAVTAATSRGSVTVDYRVFLSSYKTRLVGC